jgi:hypothetical protein
MNHEAHVLASGRNSDRVVVLSVYEIPKLCKAVLDRKVKDRLKFSFVAKEDLGRIHLYHTESFQPLQRLSDLGCERLKYPVFARLT